MTKMKTYKLKLEHIMDQYAPGYMECIAHKDNYDDFVKACDTWNAENQYVNYYKIHTEADQVLCDLLRDLGYGDIVDYFNKMPKLYE